MARRIEFIVDVDSDGAVRALRQVEEGAGAPCSGFILLKSAECWMLVGLSRPSVFMEGCAQVGGALLENTDKHGDADGPEKPQARCGLLCAGLVVADPDSARARGGRGFAVQ